jgi:hypothetical protein
MEPNEPPKREHPWNPVEIWKREWPIVKNTPTASVLCFIAGCVTIWFLYSFFIVPGKDSRIQSLQAKIANGLNPITNFVTVPQPSISQSSPSNIRENIYEEREEK